MGYTVGHETWHYSTGKALLLETIITVLSLIELAFTDTSSLVRSGVMIMITITHGLNNSQCNKHHDQITMTIRSTPFSGICAKCEALSYPKASGSSVVGVH